MEALKTIRPVTSRLLMLASATLLATAACAPQAAPPTAAPAKPAPTAAPAPPAPTAAPAKPAATAAPAKPAPTAAPAAKPTEKPAAKAAEYDEKAVADFYRGKTIRIVVGYAPGGVTDMSARLLQAQLPKYLPGNPSVVVENKPGGGSMLAANTVYTSEPKDGTVLAAIDQGLILQQAIGAPGVQFDAAKFGWLGSTYSSPAVCAVRSDVGINSIQDIMGPNGKELTVASYGKGTTSYNPPAVMNAVLGTKFKIVMGYEGDAAVLLAVKNKEVQGWCVSLQGLIATGSDLVEGSNPAAKVIVATGDTTPDHPLLKGVPAAGSLAKTDEAKALLSAIQAPYRIIIPHTAPPGVPPDRLQALRRARDKAFADPELLAAAKKAQMAVNPETGEEVARAAQQVLSLPPATLAKLKDILQ